MVNNDIDKVFEKTEARLRVLNNVDKKKNNDDILSNLLEQMVDSNGKVKLLFLMILNLLLLDASIIIW